MPKPLFFIIVVILFYSGCKVPLYLEKNTPVWRSNVLSTAPDKEIIKVLSYNIKFSLKIPTAIEELQSLENLKDADIILLQEMNEDGTKEIAETLGYNYVYYPIVYYTQHKRKFGNAVLTKWPILTDEKIIFPHKTIGNGSRRAATSTVIQIGEKKLRVISAHLATIQLAMPKKIEQIDSLIRYNVRDTLDYQIVGGDYNTLTGEEADYVIKNYRENDFKWATKLVGNTGEYLAGFLKPWNDHIFTKGFSVKNSGKEDSITASDHYPIWVELSFD